MNQRLPYLHEKTTKLTSASGVYIMKDKQGRIIYIGKAKNLKNRVTSYFRENPEHTPKVAKMVSQVYDYDFIVTDSEYEALVLECSLIKQHKPKYNILLKDDKGYHYIKVSDEAYPRITAEKHLTDSGTFLGPYVSSSITKQTVNEVNKVFRLPVCRKKFPQDFKKGRPCLYFYINQCMGVCRGEVSEAQYKSVIEQALNYIKEGSAASVERMKAEMQFAADELDFERAAILRDRINAVIKAGETQKIIDDDLQDTDVIASVKDNDSICIAVLVYRNGRLFDKTTFLFENDDSADSVIESFIMQYYSSNDIPKIVLTEQKITNDDLVERWLKERCGHTVKLIHRQKGNLLKLIMLAKSNAGEYLSMKTNRTAKEITALEELAELLGLERPPMYIEAYDISNLASTSMVAGMAVFENGRPLKNAYKRFSIKDVKIQNDYECMREVISRRFNRYLQGDSDTGFSRLPDLIFVDGGKGQVNAVEPILRELGVNVPVFGIVKDSKHRTRAIASSGAEIAVSRTKSAFMLITKIQDEMHRFAITYQRKLHSKRTYSMELTKVKGIGDKKANKLMMHYKTKDELKKASAEELGKIAGVNNNVAVELHKLIEKL